MYRLSSRRLGRTQAEDVACKASLAGGFFSPSCWRALVPPFVAPPGPPTGDALTVPPASGAQAQATVDTLLNQQLIDQQALNAPAVTSSWWDTLTGGTYSAAAGAASSAASSLPWILGGLGLMAFAFVAVGGGSARRYGR